MDYLCYINTPSPNSCFYSFDFSSVMNKIYTVISAIFIYLSLLLLYCQIRLKLAKRRSSMYVKLIGGGIEKWTTDGGLKVIKKFN